MDDLLSAVASVSLFSQYFPSRYVMKNSIERAFTLRFSSKSTLDAVSSPPVHPGSEAGPSDANYSNHFTWLGPALSVFEHYTDSLPHQKEAHDKSNGLAARLRRFISGSSMRRIHERVMGPGKTGVSSSSDIWLLGVCYKISEESSSEADGNNGLAAFKQDFSSRLWMTYRKGFDAFEDAKLTSDVGWGCMLRSSQMLVAQALLFHRLGRSWRKSSEKPLDLHYVEILRKFGDSEAAVFSIHSLVQSGKAYGLAAGCWVGPYAMCRTWESVARHQKEKSDSQSLPMAIYVVSGDEEGERGGAPVVCMEDASRRCLDFSDGQASWTPLLLLVPLVLGLDKVNPRYIPSLQATFTFPQSLGIVGGKPGVSTYIVGVQEDNGFYLDPHVSQPVIDISQDDLEVDTSSYHCDCLRRMPLNSIDPSLAIGFYCQDKGDFDDFCVRASKLADDSNGAPLFTVTEKHSSLKHVNYGDDFSDARGAQKDESFGVLAGDSEGSTNEDEWQLL